MGAHNGNLMSIFSCSILLCSFLLVMEVLFMSQNIHGMLVSLLQMPFSCSFLLLAVNLIFQGVGMAPDLQLWQSQKMKTVRFFWKLPGRLLTNLFLGLVEVGDRSQTALFRSGQYNYHWIHHHFSHKIDHGQLGERVPKMPSMPMSIRHSIILYHISMQYIAVYTVHISKHSTHVSIKNHLWWLDSWIISHPSTTFLLSSVFQCAVSLYVRPWISRHRNCGVHRCIEDLAAEREFLEQQKQDLEAVLLTAKLQAPVNPKW